MAVGLFGSLARREALPSSDADVLIALRCHPLPRWFDRVPEYGPAFDGTALPVEVFPYTVDELARGLSEPGFIRTVLRQTVTLAGDFDFFQELRCKHHL